jgi:hypothetical protein
MGFSVKLAPGVRIRASSRGVRTSIGPRAARVHFGAGRTGLSTGIGPVGLYTSVGGTRGGGNRRSVTSAQTSYQRQLAVQQRQTAQAEKAVLAQQLADTFLRILALHRVTSRRRSVLWLQSRRRRIVRRSMLTMRRSP